MKHANSVTRPIHLKIVSKYILGLPNSVENTEILPLVAKSVPIIHSPYWILINISPHAPVIHPHYHKRPCVKPLVPTYSQWNHLESES